MDTSHVLQECRIGSILSGLGITSQSANTLFREQCGKWATNLNVLGARSEAWLRLRSSNSSWKAHLPELLENEVTIRELDPSTASESQTEDWSQILFTGQFASMNFIPFVLMYVALSKIIIAPMIAWCMPFMTILLPFLALKYVYGMPITWDAYWAAMKPMIFGNIAREGLTVSTMLQWASMIVSYGHGMYIPYTNAKHCYKIDQLMLKGSRAVRNAVSRLRQIADDWVACGLRKPWTFPDPSIYGDERQVLAWLIQDKHLLPEIYRAIGRVEITAAIVSDPYLTPVEWIESPTPLCKMVDAIDPLLKTTKPVPFSLLMSQSEHHAICTGPNRGGKSTFLRSALTNLVLAHTWGVAFAGRCILTPVEWVISSLRLEDNPGEQSLFEREVSIAGDILRHTRSATGGRGWVIIDELFHTTNPPDAATASQIFLRQLWNSQTVTSIVSTHLFSHAETAPVNVQRLCVESEIEDTGKIHYTYKVAVGINTMSSVNELLVESAVLNLEESAACL